MPEIDFLAISYELPPLPLTGGIQVARLLRGLRDQGWRFEVITSVPDAEIEGVKVHGVPNPGVPGWVKTLTRLKVPKVREFCVWPDDARYWVPGALELAEKITRERSPRAILNFMMPYSAGLVGESLKSKTNLPLVYCLGDSPTCSDMHPRHPTYWHWRKAVRLEDQFVRTANAIIYVSEVTAQRVRDRQTPEMAEKVEVVRRGVFAEKFAPCPSVQPDPNGPVRIIYLGGMGGWHSLYRRWPVLSDMKLAIQDLGRYHVVKLDHRTQTPVFVGQAVQNLLKHRPEWVGQVRVEIYGSHRATPFQINKVLESGGVREVINMQGRLVPEEVGDVARCADLLFMCLPKRVDGSLGGRISAKTYEYLMTDSPILAAVPKGENWDFLKDKPGVWLTAPDDVAGMEKAIIEICEAKLGRRKPLRFDRSHLRDELSHTNRAKELSAILSTVINGSA